MQNPSAAIHFTPRRPPSRRYMAVAFVGALHVGLIYALLVGLMPPILKIVPHTVFDTHVIEATIEKPKTSPKPVEPAMQKPTVATVPPPRFETKTVTPSPIQVKPVETRVPASRVASAIGPTHSRPPYPPTARRLNHEGTVRLRLTIGPDGRVRRADIVRSSGWPELDETAAAWVVAHWRYQPALQGGVPVTATAQAAVKFDLRSAR
jgi:protein TonB